MASDDAAEKRRLAEIAALLQEARAERIAPRARRARARSVFERGARASRVARSRKRARRRPLGIARPRTPPSHSSPFSPRPPVRPKIAEGGDAAEYEDPEALEAERKELEAKIKTRADRLAFMEGPGARANRRESARARRAPRGLGRVVVGGWGAG